MEQQSELLKVMYERCLSFDGSCNATPSEKAMIVNLARTYNRLQPKHASKLRESACAKKGIMQAVKKYLER